MKNNRKLSRRAVFGALIVVPASSMTAIAQEVSSPDAKLLALGKQLDKIARAIDNGNRVDDELFSRFDDVEAAILNIQAKTMEGLSVKARAACWALLGDLDLTDGSTTDKKMAASIVRDLIRLNDPDLERPGALKELVADLS